MSFTYTNETFSGPIEVLLSMIESHKLSISEISLSIVTDDFLEYIVRLGEFQPAMVAQFLSIASTLVLIKSRSLLPVLEVSDSEEADILELEKQLQLYQTLARGVRHIAALQSEGNALYTRDSSWEESQTCVMSEGIAPSNILQSMIELIERLSREQETVSSVTEEVSVLPVVALSEIIHELKQGIRTGARMRLSELAQRFSHDRRLHRSYTIVSFLALLELMKNGEIHIEQQSFDHDIEIQEKGPVSVDYQVE
jgi:segregation and condensation protein A